MSDKLIKNKHKNGFTIAELLVVIVVIGILAAIVYLSYAGINEKAITAVVKSDLSSNVKLLKLYQVEFGVFPSGLDSSSCPNIPNIDTAHCLKFSNGNTISYTGSGQAFVLTETNTSTGISYTVTETGIISLAAPSAATFASAWGASESDLASSVVQTADGGYVVAGETYDPVNGNDAYIAKYAANGGLSWGKSWGGNDTDGGTSVIQSADGGFVMVGETYSFGVGGLDAFIAKYTADGTLSWSRTWGGSDGEDKASSVTQITDGGYIVVGHTDNFGAGSRDAFVAKFASNGSLSWSKTWGGEGYDSANSVTKTTDGGFVVAGETQSFGTGNGDTFIAKYTSDGTLSWSKTWGGPDTRRAESVAQTADGGYVITGGIGTGYMDRYDFIDTSEAFISKYSTDGALSWSRTWGGAGSDYAYSIDQINDGGFVITGQTNSFGAGNYDVFISKYTSEGALSWSKTLGGSEWDDPGSISKTNDGGFVVAGRTQSFGAGSSDSFIAKYSVLGEITGCSTPTCRTAVNPTTSIPSDTTSGNPTATEIETTLFAAVTSPDATVAIPAFDSYILF